jgi:predicted Rossmann-fold nucleotide-binding protein
MEAALRGAVEARGKTIGILTRHFDFIELRPNAWVMAAYTAEGLVDRMLALFSVGDLFVVFPGSTGTLAELSITLELINKDRVQHKRILCMGDYWKPVLGVVGNESRPFHPDKKVADVVGFVDSAEELVASFGGHLRTSIGPET